MDFRNDKRIVMSLDAGGTNLVFSAIQGNEQIIEEIILPTHADNLDACLTNIVEGFRQVQAQLHAPPVAISFAFPGPADYPRGIIGDLGNLPAFRGGIALGPMLRKKFNLPVFINNDGDLYAYGEALAGFLPSVNTLLEQSGSPKRYKNLFGVTLGTGFGGGIVRDGNLFMGDNSIAGEIWLMRDKLTPTSNVEFHASIRGIKKSYADELQVDVQQVPEPKEIYEIAIGTRAGNKNAAINAFKHLAIVVGDALSHAVTLIDGLIVIGGGLAGASPLFLPWVIDEMNSTFIQQDGSRIRRLAAHVYNLENKNELDRFLHGEVKNISVLGSDEWIAYDAEMRIGVGISKIGTSKATAIGAYSYALNSL